ncbi:MAG: branched-chain amino acid ABC transporter permease [Candidatus Bathyarchaeia archaeon]
MTVIEGAIIYSNLLALLSIGLTITYITTGVPNFAQGSFAIFGAYVSLSLFYLFGIHPYHSLLISLILGSLIGIAMYTWVLKPLIIRGARPVILMVATLAIDLIMLGSFGAYSDYLATITKKATKKFIFTPYDFELMGISAILAISTLVITLMLLSLFFLLYKTKFGIALRASMENPSLAEIMGINVEHTRIFSWLLSGALASVAGSLLPFRQEIVPASGAIIIVSIFAASIVGGLTSIYGALVGGYIVGISESLITYELASIFGSGMLLYSKVVSLIILILTLIFAPKGITSVKWRWLIRST